MTQQEFKQSLVEMVKACGEELIERAEDLVGEADLLTDFDICISFPINNYDFTGVPSIDVASSCLSKKAMDVLIKKYT